LRIGTPEITRWGMTVEHMSELGMLLDRALSGKSAPEKLAPEVSEFRRRFAQLAFVR
jgi:glycine hydroxymethyltransferase